MTVQPTDHQQPEPPPTGQPRVATSAREKIWAALAQTEATPRKLAEIAGVGYSTASPHLRALRDQGLAVDREDGGQTLWALTEQGRAQAPVLAGDSALNQPDPSAPALPAAPGADQADPLKGRPSPAVVPDRSAAPDQAADQVAAVKTRGEDDLDASAPQRAPIGTIADISDPEIHAPDDGLASSLAVAVDADEVLTGHSAEPAVGGESPTLTGPAALGDAHSGASAEVEAAQSGDTAEQAGPAAETRHAEPNPGEAWPEAGAAAHTPAGLTPSAETKDAPAPAPTTVVSAPAVAVTDPEAAPSPNTKPSSDTTTLPPRRKKGDLDAEVFAVLQIDTDLTVTQIARLVDNAAAELGLHVRKASQGAVALVMGRLVLQGRAVQTSEAPKTAMWRRHPDAE